MKYYKTFEQYNIAPNRKESNLSPELYQLVRTPEFKTWFGDWENEPEKSSKVLDENGEPLLMFHHSDKSFDSFIKTKGFNSNLLVGNEEVQRHAFFFSSDEEFSKRYGKYKYISFLNIKKPFIFGEHYYYKNNYPQYSEIFEEFEDFSYDNGIDLKYNNVTKSLEITPDYSWLFLDDELGEVFVKFLKMNKYDGVIFNEFYKTNSSDEYHSEFETTAVFDNNQIKVVKLY